MPSISYEFTNDSGSALFCPKFLSFQQQAQKESPRPSTEQAEPAPSVNLYVLGYDIHTKAFVDTFEELATKRLSDGHAMALSRDLETGFNRAKTTFVENLTENPAANFSLLEYVGKEVYEGLSYESKKDINTIFSKENLCHHSPLMSYRDFQKDEKKVARADKTYGVVEKCLDAFDKAAFCVAGIGVLGILAGKVIPATTPFYSTVTSGASFIVMCAGGVCAAVLLFKGLNKTAHVLTTKRAKNRLERNRKTMAADKRAFAELSCACG